MKTWSFFTGLILISAMAVALAGCGSKRPPAVAMAPPSAPAGAGSESVHPQPSAEPIDAGPDIRPVEGENAMGEDLTPADLSGPGGPLADIYFAYDEAALSDEARALLEKHALWLQSHRGLRVTIEGHCDERGTVEYNLALGTKRGEAAHDYLVSLGVGAERIHVVSLGKEQPQDPRHDETAWSRNRRAHFALSRQKGSSELPSPYVGRG